MNATSVKVKTIKTELIDQKQHNRPQLMVIGQSQRPTGYARVTTSLLFALVNDYEIHQFELYDIGGHIKYPWVIHRKQKEADVYGLESVPALIETLCPSILLMIGDFHICGMYENLLRNLHSNMKVVYYMPCEGSDISIHIVKSVQWVDYLVVYHEHSLAVLNSAFRSVKQDNPEMRIPKLEVIPHGINSEVFYPLVSREDQPDILASRKQARALLFPGREDVQEGFIVLNANRNTYRKRIDLTLKGFAEFVQKQPGRVWLYLHMGMRDTGLDIKTLARKLGIEDYLLVTSWDDDMPHVPNEHLNLIYNACDVGVNTSSGEGWGLVSFEHAATGAAQILPRHGGCELLWKDAAILLNTISEKQNNYDLFTHRIVSSTDLATALTWLCDDYQMLETYSLFSYQRTQESRFQWNTIAKKWDAIFRE